MKDGHLHRNVLSFSDVGCPSTSHLAGHSEQLGWPVLLNGGHVTLDHIESRGNSCGSGDSQRSVGVLAALLYFRGYGTR